MGIFDSFNQRVTGLGLPGGLGLLQAGTDILGGQPIGQAVRGGLQTFQNVTQMDEERKRKALVQDLVSKGGFTPQEQALIAATPSQNQAALAAQIRAQKAAASKPNTFQQRKTIGEQQGLLGDDLQRFILTGELPKETKFEIVPADQVEAFGFPKGTILQKNTDSGDIDVLQSAPASPTTFKYLSKSQKRDLGYDVNSVVQINDKTKQVTVVKDAPKQNEKFTILTADEVAKAGYPEGTIVQKSDLTGKQNIIQSVPNKDSNKLTLTKAELKAQGFNEGDVVQKDEDTGALTVVRSAAAPKNTSLVNLVSQQDVTIDGRTYKAGTVFALDQTTQQKQLLEAGKQGAILAPSKVENITGDADTGEQPPAISPVSPIEIETAAGGDIAGFAKDFFNFVGGVTMIGEPATARRDEQTNIAALENAVLPGLVRSISSTGAVRTQEGAKKLIPNIYDSDNKMSSKVNALIPVLQQKLQEADNVLKSPGKITASQRTLATQITSTYPQIISAMQLSKDRYEKRNAKSETQKKADEILGF